MDYWLWWRSVEFSLALDRLQARTAGQIKCNLSYLAHLIFLQCNHSLNSHIGINATLTSLWINIQHNSVLARVTQRTQTCFCETIHDMNPPLLHPHTPLRRSSSYCFTKSHDYKWLSFSSSTSLLSSARWLPVHANLEMKP